MTKFYFTMLLALATSTTAAEEQLATSTEKLLAEPPPDWTEIYQINNVDTRIIEFVPPDQSAKHWTTKIAFESFRRLTDADPIKVLLQEVEQSKKKCSFVQHFNLFSGHENGYPTSIRLIMCGKNENLDKGEVELVKAIKGNDYFYIVRFVDRIPPFEVNEPEFAKRKIATWSTYMRLIGLCDPESEDHACSTE